MHAKGVVEALYAALKAEPRFERGEDPALHPGKTARTSAGIVGELHPAARGHVERVRARPRGAVRGIHDPVNYCDVITYPAVRQDIAFVVAEDVAAGALVAAAQGRGRRARRLRVFDVYRGEPVPAGRKSVAFSVAFQSPDRTLTDEDAAQLRGAIVDALAEQFGAELRA